MCRSGYWCYGGKIAYVVGSYLLCWSLSVLATAFVAWEGWEGGVRWQIHVNICFIYLRDFGGNQF
jgi:hypothetical protein